MQFWVIQTLNSLALGGLLFLLAAGFSLIFGLMRIANLAHGALYMLGAYFGASLLGGTLPLRVPGLEFSVPVPEFARNLWMAALIGGLLVAAFGGLLERLILRRLPGNELGQVLVTLGIAYIIADACLMNWGGDNIPLPAPEALEQPLESPGSRSRATAWSLSRLRSSPPSSFIS
jgi:branched-chain amino acid transport system permease protein